MSTEAEDKLKEQQDAQVKRLMAQLLEWGRKLLQ